MMLKKLPQLALFALLLSPTAKTETPDYAAMLEERLASVVAVEFSIEHEMDRTVNYAHGLVIDNDGTVILEGGAISDRATPDQLVDFKFPESGTRREAHAATYHRFCRAGVESVAPNG